MADQEPVLPATHLTRRERRIARSRARRATALVGWMTYGAGVFVVIMTAAWLAVGAATAPAPAPVARTAKSTRAEVALPDVTSTTAGAAGTAAAPVVAPAIASTTTTTTVPVLSVAATPGAPAPTP
ncbi:MAG: hypothetical protein WD598_02435 [Acidimicrobiia bacterium]